MKKIIFAMIAVLLMNISIVAAISQQEINEGKNLIDMKTSCKTMSDSQLEIVGEYLMEQMHPGESHELMHQMMGLKEDSEQEKQFHVGMARMMYCSSNSNMTNVMMGSNMMGNDMMPMMDMMMDGGMMNMMMGGNMDNVMMGNNPMNLGRVNDNSWSSFAYWSFWNVIWMLFWIGIVVLIIWLIYKLIIKHEVETPIETLKKRYSKGEINEKRFKDMKKEIME